jgi:hypothetical protein
MLAAHCRGAFPGVVTVAVIVDYPRVRPYQEAGSLDVPNSSDEERKRRRGRSNFTVAGSRASGNFRRRGWGGPVLSEGACIAGMVVLLELDALERRWVRPSAPDNLDGPEPDSQVVLVTNTDLRLAMEVVQAGQLVENVAAAEVL